MNEWSDLASDWQQLSPDLTAMVKRTKRRGRWLHGFFWYQTIGTFVAVPVLIWSFWLVDEPVLYGILCATIGFISGWWAAAWPIWRELRQARPPTRPRAVVAHALRHVRGGRRLAALEMGVGLFMVLFMGLIWLTSNPDATDQRVILAGAAISFLWFAASWRYWRKLGREADELLGRNT